jgi:protein ImuB
MDRLRATQTQPDALLAERPLAFVENKRGAVRIAAVSPAALTLGIAPGMALADARAQHSDLATVAHDAAADARWLARIADDCERYTPAAAVDPPDALVLDITGCSHLFGGEPELIADIRARLAGLHLRIAAAAVPEAALALARFGTLPVMDEEAAVLALPIAALRLDGAIETALSRAGLNMIGDLADRPTAPLTARFGAAMTAALERMLGRADSRITPRRPPPALIFERRFAEPISRVETALAALETLTGEAAAELAGRGCGGRKFAARFYRSDGARADLVVETGGPVREPAVVMRLFHERIAALADPIDPGFGFDMIRLSVPVLEPLDPLQLALGGSVMQEEALAALVDRLSARLGRRRVRRFALRNSHIPERAFQMIQAANCGSPRTLMSTMPGYSPLRPLHLFDPPQPIEVIAEVPDGPPRRFHWQRTAHDVVRHEGPERIASEWWQPGKAGLTRDYYRIEDACGRRFWIFRYGLYGSERAAPGWYIHGLFA